MYINFKVLLILPFLVLGRLSFSQTDALFTSYLEGDYKTILESSTASSDNELLYQASAYSHTGEYQKAVSLFSVVQNKSTVLFLNEQGFLLLKMFQLDKAKINFEKALVLSQSKKDEEGERLANTNLALYHLAVGNYDLQQDYAYKAAKLSIELYGPLSLTTAGMNNNLALSLSSSDDRKEVIKLYDGALESYKKRTEGFIKPLICRVHVNKALFMLTNNDLAESERYALKALACADSNDDNSIFVYTTLGAIYSEKEDLETSKKYLFKALDLNNQNHIKERIELYNRIAEVLRLEKEFKLANSYLDSAITLNVLDMSKNEALNNVLSLDAKLSSYYEKGALYFDWYYGRSLKTKHLQASAAAFERCIEILDLERKIRVTQKDKIRIGEISKGIYDKLIKCTYDLAQNTFKKKIYDSKVFVQIQQSKAAVLNESMNENIALNFSGVPESVIQKERTLKSKIGYFEQASALNRNEKQFTDSLSRLRGEYEKFTILIEKTYPRYYSLKYQKNVKSAAEFQIELPENKLLISYYLTADAQILYVACVDNNGLRITEVLTGDDFIGKVNAFRNHINFKVYGGYNELSNSLFKMLIPYPKDIESKSVVFFPDGVLNSLPFEALSTSKSDKFTKWSEEPYLINGTDVGYGISTALYAPYNKVKLESYSLYAPVTFDYGDEFYLSNLPYTQSEVESIDSVLHDSDVKIHLNERANKKQILSDLKADVLHLATHGLIDQKNPELSRLCLSASKDANFLYNNEIYNLTVNFELVTISACETGLGKLSKGEGVIGLTRAWVYAGAKNLIVSYWPVNDYATSELMTDFYSNVSKNSFSQSLRKAKQSLIVNEGTSAPYFWAGFVLIGE